MSGAGQSRGFCECPRQVRLASECGQTMRRSESTRCATMYGPAARTSGKTSKGHHGTQSLGCAGQTVRPSLHSISQTSAGKLLMLNYPVSDVREIAAVLDLSWCIGSSRSIIPRWAGPRSKAVKAASHALSPTSATKSAIIGNRRTSPDHTSLARGTTPLGWQGMQQLPRAFSKNSCAGGPSGYPYVGFCGQPGGESSKSCWRP